jgi:hypothetical protein
MPRWFRLLAGPVVVTVLAAGCTGGADDAPEPDGTSSSPTATAEPPPAPERGACYRLRFKEALSPTVDRPARPCRQPHTAETYRVGALDLVADGHLLAVDSDRVQEQPARRCPRALPGYVGGDQEALRLSMIQPVWFTPTLAEADQGADWFRCDAVVLAGRRTLAERTGSLRGALGRPNTRDQFAMCGTAAPDAADFERVVCSEPHSWRAVAVVDFEARGYPGEANARQRGQSPCENAGLDNADDPLDYEWGYEWPTEEQWQAGMTYGRCWVPVG